jgi:hypothetical protein
MRQHETVNFAADATLSYSNNEISECETCYSQAICKAVEGSKLKV